MRVAVFGGSFNPPHVCHAMVAGWLRWTDRADEVWLLPTYVHPFDKALAPFAARLAMCEALAEAVGSWVKVCPIEQSLEVPSYTIDTLRALEVRHPEHRFRLVVGADVLDQVQDWKQWDRIEQDYTPIRVGRAGYPVPPGAVEFPALSSTRVRSALAAGQAVDHLVPAPVLPLLGEWYAG